MQPDPLSPPQDELRQSVCRALCPSEAAADEVAPSTGVTTEHVRATTEFVEMLARLVMAAARPLKLHAPLEPHITTRRTTFPGAVCERALLSTLKSELNRSRARLRVDWQRMRSRHDLPNSGSAPARRCQFLRVRGMLPHWNGILRLVWLPGEASCPGCGGSASPCLACQSQTRQELAAIGVFREPDQELDLQRGGDAFAVGARSEDLRRELRAVMGDVVAPEPARQNPVKALLRMVALSVMADLAPRLPDAQIRQLHPKSAEVPQGAREPPAHSAALITARGDEMRAASNVRACVEDGPQDNPSRLMLPQKQLTVDGEAGLHEKSPGKKLQLVSAARFSPTLLARHEDVGAVLEAAVAAISAQRNDSTTSKGPACYRLRDAALHGPAHDFARLRIEGAILWPRAKDWQAKRHAVGIWTPADALLNGEEPRLSVLDAQMFHDYFRKQIVLRLDDWRMDERAGCISKDGVSSMTVQILGPARVKLAGLRDLVETARETALVRLPRKGDQILHEGAWRDVDQIAQLKVRRVSGKVSDGDMWEEEFRLQKLPPAADTGAFPPLAFAAACVCETDGSVNIRLNGGTLCAPVQTRDLPVSSPQQATGWEQVWQLLRSGALEFLPETMAATRHRIVAPSLQEQVVGPQAGARREPYSGETKSRSRSPRSWSGRYAWITGELGRKGHVGGRLNTPVGHVERSAPMFRTLPQCAQPPPTAPISLSNRRIHTGTFSFVTACCGLSPDFHGLANGAGAGGVPLFVAHMTHDNGTAYEDCMPAAPELGKIQGRCTRNVSEQNPARHAGVHARCH